MLTGTQAHPQMSSLNSQSQTASFRLFRGVSKLTAIMSCSRLLLPNPTEVTGSNRSRALTHIPVGTTIYG